MRLIDSHSHVDSAPFHADRAEVLARARAAGVEHVVVVGLWRENGGVQGARDAVELAATDRSFLSAAACVHPHDASAAPEADVLAVEELAARPDVVAVGETGLDYHYHHSTPEEQMALFRRFARLARRLDKPLVVHTREAEADTYRVLDEEGLPGRGGVIHCFTGDRAAVHEYLARGLYVSISGIVTFKSSDELREAAKLVPLERLLVETDAPYCAPVPHRGKRNEPAFVEETAKVLAAVKGIDTAALAEATAENARRFYGLAWRAARA